MKPTCSSSSNSLTTIMDLPDDCLIFIFQCLVSGSDRESFGLTCHRCLRVQNLSRRSLQFQCSFKQLDISSLSLSAFTLVVPIWVHRATRFRLVPLVLCCLGITDHGLYMAATGCPSLQVISLYRCQITDFGLGNLDKSCSVLKDVNLLYCYCISDCGLKALSQVCRQLQAVKISHCKGITGVGFKGSSSTLAYVGAKSCKLEPECLLGIVSGGGIEYLNISGILQNCRNGLAAIGRGFAFRLKILNLRLCRTFGDMSIVAIAEGCPLLHFHKLEKLHVNRCRNLCDQGLVALRNGCKQLSVLYMNGFVQCYRSEVTIKNEEKCIGPIWELR
ncbi:unnamed protein product [Malus baccata var. baccata]